MNRETMTLNEPLTTKVTSVRVLVIKSIIEKSKNNN